MERGYAQVLILKHGSLNVVMCLSSSNAREKGFPPLFRYVVLRKKSNLSRSVRKMADQKKGPEPFNTSLFSSGLDFDTSSFTISPVSKPVQNQPPSGEATPSSATKTQSITPPHLAKRENSPIVPPQSDAKTAATSKLFSSLPLDSPAFNASKTQQPSSTTVPKPELELETVDIGSPSKEDPVPPIQIPATIPPGTEGRLSPGLIPGHAGVPSTFPPVAAVPPLQHQMPSQVPGGDTTSTANPYRLTSKHMGRPTPGQSSMLSQHTFPAGGVVPPTSTQIMQPPSTMASAGYSPIIPPTTGSTGYSPIIPPTTGSTGYSPIIPPTTSSTGYSPIIPPTVAPSQATPPVQYADYSGVYNPVRPHWFYLRSGDRYWLPFTLVDSSRLEQLYQKQLAGSLPSNQIISTDGGRYDVNFTARTRSAVYWSEEVSSVRRCTWFYRGEMDRWYLPYDEQLSQKLEEEYYAGMAQQLWNRKIPLENNEVIVMHSSTSVVHYPPPPGGMPLDIDEQYSRPKAVKREFTEIDQVSQGEQSRIDHLVFVIHGIGDMHDINFRNIVDCVDDFREVAQLMLQTHRFQGQAPRNGDEGGRVELLPIHWHATLHSGGTGIDSRVKPLTLKSIKRLRDFTNTTLLDILFYTSPVYCQTIVAQVTNEMNRLHQLFLSRNPTFKGGVSLMGHSLGSCIAFDILQHQCSDSVVEEADEGEKEDTEEIPTLVDVLSNMGLQDQMAAFEKEKIDYESLMLLSYDDLKELGIPMGPRKKLAGLIKHEKERILQIKAEKESKALHQAEKVNKKKKKYQEMAALEETGLKMVPFAVSKNMAGTGQSFVDYTELDFKPENFFAIGSPIGLFLTVRGVDLVGPNFCLPTCPHFYNIFHPYDPVAYRIEPLIDPAFGQTKPILLPHHKGRKRFHLELYENLGRVGTTLKENFLGGVRNMWESISEFARSHTTGQAGGSSEQQAGSVAVEPKAEPEVPSTPSDQDGGNIFSVLQGRLNKDGRIDHVLQEKPIETLNEYLFAISSHLTYWRSEDTALFLLKQTYKEQNPELVKL